MMYTLHNAPQTDLEKNQSLVNNNHSASIKTHIY